MKRELFLMFLIFQLAAAVAFADLHVKKSTLAPQETGFIHEKPRETFMFWWAASLAVLPDSSAMVFFSDSTNVKGRKINPDGKLNGKPFVAFAAPENKTQLLDPSAVFSTTSKGTRGILIAAEDNDPPGVATTWAQVLDSNGVQIGAPALVSATAENETTRAAQIAVLPVKPTNKSYQFQFYQTVAPLDTYNFAKSEILKFKLSLTEP